MICAGAHTAPPNVWLKRRAAGTPEMLRQSWKLFWFQSGLRRGGLTGKVPAIVCLSSCGRCVADGFEQAMVGEPGHPFQRDQLDGLLVLPGRPTMNAFGLVTAADRLGQGVDAPMSRGAHRIRQVCQDQWVKLPNDIGQC